MKKMNVIAFMAMFLPLWAAAQFTISGKVVDGSVQRPLAGANVTVNQYSSQTDANGDFSFLNLKAGNYVVKVSFIGFNTFSKVLNLSANQNLNISMQASSFVTDAVIVKATRASESSPTTFKNIDNEELAKNNLGQDLPYLLNQTPSVVVSSDAGNGIGYTGIRIRGSDPTRVNVTINGIPYNDPESQGTFWVNLPDFASSVDNIQIQRGVGTSTNGAVAFGGSLNIQTTTRHDTAYAELNSAGGSFGTLKNTINAGSGLIANKFTVDGRLSAITSDGFIDRGSSNLKSFFSSAAYYGKKDLLRVNIFGGKEKTYQVWNGVPEAKLRGNSDALLTHYYNNQGSLYFTPEDSLNLWNSDKRTYSQFLYNNQTDNYNQTHYQGLYTHTFNPALSLNTALHYTFGKGYFEEFKNNTTLEKYGLNSTLFGGAPKQKTDLVRRRWLKNDFYGLTYSLNYAPSTEYSVIIGGAYNEYDGDHFGEVISATLPVSSINQQYYLGHGLKKDFNIYGRIDFQVGKARIFYDLQYRYVDYSITGTDKTLAEQDLQYYHKFFNPKAGITYSIDNHSNAYASFAIGNKEPNRDDYRYALPGVVPQAETLKNVEAGYRNAEKAYNFGINYYGMFYRNQLVLTGKVNDVGEYIRQNVPISYRMGFELDGRVLLSKDLSWGANVTLSRNKVKNYTEFMDDYDNGGQASNTYGKADIAFSPSVIAGSDLSYKIFKGFETALLSKYVGKQYLDNTSNEDRKLNPFFVNDISLRYNIQARRLKNIGLTLLVNNVFNEKYESNGYTYTYIYGGPVTENFYFPQAGTNVLLGLNIKI
ncbi:TonB-dependent receptor [Desertivirga arenae]|uniref:TonB-dependent receptor n=1 Tax=Desertivirga arenae TaxID=2810309 RepID=UPI001A96F734|nr:TonB-dependent receptor [Pedobacter sp. SYSU D00823]